MEPTIALLREHGVPGEQVRSEAFLAAKRTDVARVMSGLEVSPGMSPALAGAAAADLAQDLSGPPAVTFARSAKRALLSPEKSLLELSEEAGLSIDYECRSGVCGRCKTKLLAGSVTMEVQDALDESDKANHFILLCQAKATEHVTVEA
jgi:ferredoxin